MKTHVQKGTCFQVISRNNDTNGNPYRLILVYGKDANSLFAVVEAIEARSSSPNIVGTLHRLMPMLPSFHVSPTEYKETKGAFINVWRKDN